MTEPSFTAWFGTLGQWFAGSATLCAVLYVVYRDHFKRPKLILRFDNKKDVRDQINTVGHPPGLVSRWLRVRVQNKNGRKAAKNCRAFLIGVEYIGPDGQIEDVFPNDVRQLQWTHNPPGQEGRDLLPGVVHQFDLVGALNDGKPCLCVQVTPPYIFHAPGKYCFTAQVSAEDADSQIIQIRVQWGEDWRFSAIP